MSVIWNWPHRFSGAKVLERKTVVLWKLWFGALIKLKLELSAALGLGTAEKATRELCVIGGVDSDWAPPAGTRRGSSMTARGVNQPCKVISIKLHIPRVATSLYYLPHVIWVQWRRSFHYCRLPKPREERVALINSGVIRTHYQSSSFELIAYKWRKKFAVYSSFYVICILISYYWHSC